MSISTLSGCSQTMHWCCVLLMNQSNQVINGSWMTSCLNQGDIPKTLVVSSRNETWFLIFLDISWTSLRVHHGAPGGFGAGQPPVPLRSWSLLRRRSRSPVLWSSSNSGAQWWVPRRFSPWATPAGPQLSSLIFILLWVINHQQWLTIITYNNQQW